jgi:hypothetical protein
LSEDQGGVYGLHSKMLGDSLGSNYQRLNYVKSTDLAKEGETMRPSTWNALGFAALSSGALIAGPAHAQALSDKYWIEGSAYFAHVDTDAEVTTKPAGGAPIIGSNIDFESDLGLNDHKTLPAVTAGARLGSNFSVIGEYYKLGRDGERAISRDITFDGVTFPVNGTVSSKFDSDIYRLAVGYSFVHNKQMDIGAALGAHVTDFTLQLAGTGTVAGSPAATVETRRRSTTAPLPTIGLYGTYEVAPKVTVGGRIDYLKLSISDYDGRLVNAQANVVYRFMDNVGVGAAYRYVDYHLGINKSTWEGDIKYKFYGPTIFLQVGF